MEFIYFWSMFRFLQSSSSSSSFRSPPGPAPLDYHILATLAPPVCAPLLFTLCCRLCV